MNERKDLAALLRQWREFTEAEGEAIRSASWDRVCGLQGRKAALQISLAEIKSQMSAKNPDAIPAHLRLEAGRLISLETRNAELLAAQLGRARERQNLLDEARCNLQKIQRSYVGGPVSGLWESYS